MAFVSGPFRFGLKVKFIVIFIYPISTNNIITTTIKNQIYCHRHVDKKKHIQAVFCRLIRYMQHLSY